MAVPKRFKFKSKKQKYTLINNNSKYITPLKDKYFLLSLKSDLWKK